MVAFSWNMHQFRFDSRIGRLKLGAVEDEMEQSQASLLVLTEVCGSLTQFRAKGKMCGPGYAHGALMLCSSRGARPRRRRAVFTAACWLRGGVWT